MKVMLTEPEVEHLTEYISKEVRSVQKLKCANVLLELHKGS